MSVEAFFKWIRDMPEDVFNFLCKLKDVSFARGVYNKESGTYYYIRVIHLDRREEHFRVENESELMELFGILHELKKLDRSLLALRHIACDPKAEKVISFLQRTFGESKEQFSPQFHWRKKRRRSHS